MTCISYSTLSKVVDGSDTGVNAIYAKSTQLFSASIRKPRSGHYLGSDITISGEGEAIIVSLTPTIMKMVSKQSGILEKIQLLWSLFGMEAVMPCEAVSCNCHTLFIGQGLPTCFSYHTECKY